MERKWELPTCDFHKSRINMQRVKQMSLETHKISKLVGLKVGLHSQILYENASLVKRLNFKFSHTRFKCCWPLSVQMPLITWEHPNSSLELVGYIADLQYGTFPSCNIYDPLQLSLHFATSMSSFLLCGSGLVFQS